MLFVYSCVIILYRFYLLTYSVTNKLEGKSGKSVIRKEHISEIKWHRGLFSSSLSCFFYVLFVLGGDL